MRILEQLARNVLDLSINDLLKKIYDLSEFEALVIELNTDVQLFEQGIDANEQSLGEYTAFTKELKKQKGQPTDRITLKDTGDFYKSFRVRSTNNGFVIMANAIKEDTDLTQEFGEDIIGLTDLSISQVQLFLLDELIPAVRKQIFKGL